MRKGEVFMYDDKMKEMDTSRLDLVPNLPLNC